MAITDPTDIAGLMFWGDAANITENPAGKAEIMDNREGTATEDLSQSTSDRRPDISTIFGKAALEFRTTATDESLNGGALSPVAGTLIMVLRLDPAVSGINAVMWNGTILAGSQAPALWKGSNDLHMKVGRSSLTAVAFNTSPDSDWAWGDDVLLTMTWDGVSDAMTLRINKIAKGSGTVSNLNGMSSGHTIAAKNGVEGSDINIYGIVVYTSILTGVDLTDIEDFMTTTYLPVNVLTADAGDDQSIVADESESATVILDGIASFGPLSITNYEWKEGTTILATGPESTAIVSLPVGAHVITLTITDTNSDTDTDTVTKTVTAFVPPTPPTIRTFKEITSSTSKVHAFNDVFPLTPESVAPVFTEFHNQLRVFKKDVADVVTELFPVGRKSSSGTTDFTINTAGTSITLDVALVATDTLVIMRETQINRQFVTFMNVGRFRGRDRNVLGDQILFVAQELREIRQIADILGSDTGELFEYDPTPIDRSDWNQIYTGDGATTNFSYSDIEMLPLEAVRHAPQLIVLVDDVVQSSGITITESTLLVTFDVAPIDGALIEIRRDTRIDKRWVSFVDGSTFSSLLDRWDFFNIKFIAEETQDFPVFLLPNPLSNRIFPRPLNTITYSGPGDRFFFGNLAWFGDGSVFVFKNDLQLTEDVDYTINFIFFFITLTTPLVSSDTLVIITTTPNCVFSSLCYSFPGGQKNSEEDAPELPEELKGTADSVLLESNPTVNSSSDLFKTFNFAPSSKVITPVIQFDVKDIDPAGFSSIRLAYFVTAKISTATFSVFIRRCLRVWDINKTLTWNEFAKGFSWTTPGALGADTDYDPASEITWATTGPFPIVNSHWISPDISTLITAARAGDGILRMLLVPSTTVLHAVGTVDHPFASKHPQLVTYL